MPEVCKGCDRTFVRAKGRKRHYCPECAAARSVRNNTSIAYQQGEAYEKMVTGQLRHWTAEAKRLGLPLDI